MLMHSRTTYTYGGRRHPVSHYVYGTLACGLIVLAGLPGTALAIIAGAPHRYPQLLDTHIYVFALATFASLAFAAVFAYAASATTYNAKSRALRRARAR